MKKRRSIPLSIRALLQQEVASACPFCGSSDVDHFEIHHIDDDPNNNDVANLMMVCPTCHSKITKGRHTVACRAPKEAAIAKQHA